MKKYSGHRDPICKSHYNMKTVMKVKVDETFDLNEYAKSLRRIYINKCLNHQPLNRCPECGGEIEYSSEDEDEAICTECGLITSASISYVAGVKIDLPYGLRLS